MGTSPSKKLSTSTPASSAFFFFHALFNTPDKNACLSANLCLHVHPVPHQLGWCCGRRRQRDRNVHARSGSQAGEAYVRQGALPQGGPLLDDRSVLRLFERL